MTRLPTLASVVALSIAASACDAPVAQTNRAAATEAPGVTPSGSPSEPKWILVAQFKGADTETTTRVFSISPSPHPWRLTWLTYFALHVEVIDAKLGAVVESARVVQSPGPPRIGDFRVCCPGDFYLRISAVGQYQIDVEQLR